MNGKLSYFESDFDVELNNIEHIKLHPEYKPFIGQNFHKVRVLFVGESHYIKEGNTMDYTGWYEKSTAKLFENCTNEERENIGWFNTRGVINYFLNKNPSRASGIFREPAKVIMEIMGDSCTSFPEAFSYMAFCNYFQRPALLQGQTFHQIIDGEFEITRNIFDEIIKIMKPEMIVFLSRKAYFAYNRSPEGVIIKNYQHPACSWWTRKNCHEQLKIALEPIFSKLS